MPGMHSLRLIAILVAVCLTPACTMWNKTASGWSGATGGEKLEKLFWDDVVAKDERSLDRHVAATFSGSGPGGAQDRDAFLRTVQGYGLKSVSLRDCTSKLNGADVIIACTIERHGAGGSLDSVHTLSVWQQLAKGWVMVAHAETPTTSQP
jgi:hypothetical protein